MRHASIYTIYMNGAICLSFPFVYARGSVKEVTKVKPVVKSQGILEVAMTARLNEASTSDQGHVFKLHKDRFHRSRSHSTTIVSLASKAQQLKLVKGLPLRNPRQCLKRFYTGLRPAVGRAGNNNGSNRTQIQILSSTSNNPIHTYYLYADNTQGQSFPKPVYVCLYLAIRS